MATVVEHLPNKCMTLSSNLNTAQKRGGEGELLSLINTSVHPEVIISSSEMIAFIHKITTATPFL
jgi:hypothetical protein